MPPTPPATESLQGVLERIIFFNEENHYCIAEFRPDDGSAKVTITGPLPGVQCGETLNLSGRWVRHPQHGSQFRIESFRSQLPATVYGIRKYLGSGLVPGIGKVYANKIVDAFGIDTLRIISEESARLRTVPGIGKERAKSIKAAWDAQRALREIMIFLQTYGVTVSQCSRIVKKFGGEAKTILTTEPYRVAREIDGIGFKTADRIAINLGFANDSPARLDAGLIFALEELAEEGHTAFPEADLLDHAAEMLQTDRQLLAERLEELLRSRALVRRPAAGDLPKRIQLPANDRFETRIAAVINRLQRTQSRLPPIKVDAAVTWAQERAGFEFAEAQSAAVREALTNKIFILTGGPGTGKTTILRALVEILRAKKVRVHLAAPTGRAAQRLAETTGGYAQTIHRLLKFDPGKGGFTVNEGHPLATDCLIVDEASMLDTRMAASLFQAVPNGAHLVLVGDTDQLPSVGPGNVLNDLIQSDLIPVVRLNAVFRQKSWSLIVSVAHGINRGETAMPPIAPSPSAIDPAHDLTFIPADSPEDCLAKIKELCRDLIPRTFRLDPITDVQVLAPMHRGVAGVANLNQELQETLNGGHGDQTVRGPAGAFRPGDKVIQLRNNYDKGIFNGDIGQILDVDAKEGTVTADFDGDRQVFDRSDLSDLSTAYAISIHKSQGSEYPVVVIPLLKQHFMMLQRNLIYTAITRGKKRVFLVGDPAAYAMAIRNAESKQRCTALVDRLQTEK